jgi:pilus assembly protein CpaC
VNGKILVDGEILLARDMNRIVSVVAQFGDQASSIVTLSPLAQKKIAEMIERDIGNPEIRVRAVNEKFMLEGVAESDAEKQKAVIIAKTHVPDVIVDQAEKDGTIKKRKFDSVIDLLTVKPGPEPQPGKIIKLIVHYVELKKDYTKGFRFQWTPSLKDGSSVTFRSTSSSEAGGLIGTITGTIDGLLPKLNFAKNHGHARVLQSSSIIVQDGNQGIIKSQTRIPYLIQNQYGQQSTAFEEAGIDTQITPQMVSPKSDSISLQINFTIKALLGLTEKGPITSNNTITTKVVVRSSQSAAIGGLVSNSSGTNYNKLPEGGSNSVLPCVEGQGSSL